MKLLPNRIYHVYNRGNQRQTIFFNAENYLFFLKKVRKYWLPYCDILCYCLMPNHFHFLIKTNETTVQPFQPAASPGLICWTNFSWATQQLLTHYTRAIQKQEHFTGSLFTQNTKAKQVSSEWSWEDYTLWCFRYILQNPVKAKLVKHTGEWAFSAYLDFAGLRNGTLCNQALAAQELSFDLNPFDTLLDMDVPSEIIKKLFYEAQHYFTHCSFYACIVWV